MIDPVMRDLDRYLAEQEEADALSTLEDQKVKEWFSDVEKVAEAVSEVLEDDVCDAIAEIMVSTEEPSTRFKKLYAFFEDKIQEKLKAKAPEAVQADIEQSKQDAAEAAAEAREDYFDGGF
jgi:hypothetical protein